VRFPEAAADYHLGGMRWRLRRLLRRTERSLRKADTPGAVLATFEQFTEDIADLRARIRKREERRGLSYLP